MKRNKIFVILACLCLLFTATSCSNKKIKTIRGLVTKVEANVDTLKSMTLSTSDGNKIFSLGGVRFNEGVMMEGDSIIVDFTNGKHDTARALVVTVLPKTPHYVDLSKKDTTGEVKTVPASEVKMFK